MALGTAEVGLMEMTAAYAALANKGIGAMPHGILEVRDGQDHVLYRRHGSGRGQVARPWHVEELGRMLARTIRIGTGRNARLGRPAAGKTGTSQDYRDAWFLGFTPQLVAGVWLGNDNGAPMNRVTGGGAPARLWRDFMVAAHKDLPARPLKQAKGRASAGQRGETFFDKLWKSLGSGGSSNPRNNSNDQNNRDHP
jgi:penicillin-binding protein 1A